MVASTTLSLIAELTADVNQECSYVDYFYVYTPPKEEVDAIPGNAYKPEITRKLHITIREISDSKRFKKNSCKFLYLCHPGHITLGKEDKEAFLCLGGSSLSEALRHVENFLRFMRSSENSLHLEIKDYKGKGHRDEFLFSIGKYRSCWLRASYGMFKDIVSFHSWGETSDFDEKMSWLEIMRLPFSSTEAVFSVAKMISAGFEN